jgi:DNA-binding CsgD family transcriptional regulator
MGSNDASSSLDHAAADVEPEAGQAADRLLAPMADALDGLRQGLLLVDAAAGILAANRQAQALVAVGDGLRRSPDGLCADTPEQTRALRRLISAAAKPGGTGRAAGTIAIPRRFARRPLAVLVASCHPRTRLAAAIRPQHAALVFIADPECAPPAPSDALRQLYRLSRVEADVALAVLRGQGVEAMAESLGVPPSAARTHLQDIFDKTEIRRQAYLVQLLLCSVPDVNRA